MQFESPYHTIESQPCKELYPFSSKSKRYFKACPYNDNSQNQSNSQSNSYRIIVYPLSLIKPVDLYQYLQTLKEEIDHPYLGKIKEIKEKTTLVTQTDHLEKEEVMAVYAEDSTPYNFKHFYEFLIELGNFSSPLIRTFMQKMLNLLKYIRSKPAIKKQGLNFQDIYINNQTLEIRIDNYGDRNFFILGDKLTINGSNTMQKGSNEITDSFPCTQTDNWQLGFILFTFFNMFPPYSKPCKNDKLFTLLQKGTFDKFWQTIKKKSKTPDTAKKLINSLFNIKAKISLDDFQNSEWMTEQKQNILTDEQVIEQIKKLREEKENKRRQYDQKNKQFKEKCQDAIAKNHLPCRYTESDEFIRELCDKVTHQENFPREVRYVPLSAIKQQTHLLLKNNNTSQAFAYLLTYLKFYNEKHPGNPFKIKLDLQAQKPNNKITFTIEGQIEEQFYQIQQQFHLSMKIQLELCKQTQHEQMKQGNSNIYVIIKCNRYQNRVEQGIEQHNSIIGEFMFYKIWIINHITEYLSDI